MEISFRLCCRNKHYLHVFPVCMKTQLLAFDFMANLLWYEPQFRLQTLPAVWCKEISRTKFGFLVNAKC